MIIHIVSQGETLTGIAQQYGTTAENLTQQNGLPNPDNLVIGQAIVIPTQSAKIGDIAINGYAYSSIDRDVLRRTLPYITYLTIFSYGLNTDASIIPTDDDELIALANQNGVVPIMLLTAMTPDGTFSGENAGLVISNPELRSRLIENVSNTLVSKGYGGIDVDFEYIPSEYRQDYIDFISELRTALEPLGLVVFVALAPKTSSTQTGLLYEAHDYAGLADAATRVLLMTYEWGYSYGPPMAVSPLDKVSQVVNYALTQMPADKIFMGVPNYGYNWTLPYARGSRAPSISNVDAISLAAQYNAEIEYDTISQAPYFYYSDENTTEHVVWFEDARSIEAKMRYANENGLYGVGVWNIMKFFPQLWLVASELFNIIKT